MSDLISEAVLAHLDRLVPERPAEMVEMEAWAREHDFPIIGPVAGRFCFLLGRMIGARRIFEMGSGYGYSTAWFARAVRENGGAGEVHHTVWDQDLSDRAKRHLNALGLGDLVVYHVAEAVETLEAASGEFDLIFNDIDKAAYPDSLPAIRKKLRQGGLLVVDNMLWHGRIFDSHDSSPATAGVRELTRMLRDDPEWITSVVPIRDGLLVALRS